MARRAAQIRHIRVPVRTLTITGRTLEQPLLGSGSLFRSMSLHGHDHIAEEVVETVFSVVDSFPKVDTSEVCASFLYLFFSLRVMLISLMKISCLLNMVLDFFFLFLVEMKWNRKIRFEYLYSFATFSLSFF